MSTDIIQIGNSDDKLTQAEWSRFIAAVEGAVKGSGATVFFFGTSPGREAWQNACWVISLRGDKAGQADLMGRLRQIAGDWRQDSIAYSIGRTLFLSAKQSSEGQLELG